MPGAVELSRTDLEAKYTASYVRSVFGDNGNGRPGPRVETALAVARRLADAVLLKAWNEEQISVLVYQDESIRSQVLSLAMSEGMEGRPEWDNGADGPRERMRKNALANLELIVKGELRSRGENHGAGTNPHTRLGSVRTERTPHTFVFAGTKSHPRRGGF